MSAIIHQPPLIAHVVYRLGVGGLENGLVNLINHLPRDAFRHMVISLTDITDFRRRVLRDDVEFIALEKPPGHAIRLYPRITRLLRERRPAIVHTRNLAALEAVVPARAAGVPVCIHGEHGRDESDRDGSNRKYQLIRRLYSPFVSSYIALSRDLEDYLYRCIGVDWGKVDQIYNGVDTRIFHPPVRKQDIAGCPFRDEGHWLVGAVGRMDGTKDQATLARAFVRALALAPGLRSRLRLVLAGDGPERHRIERILQDAGAADLAWLPGQRDDVPDILRSLDCFVLPSLAEGISNALLEAMATALPVIATAVGGNGELVRDRQSGILVPPSDPEALAGQIIALAFDPEEAGRLGEAARKDVKYRFSLPAMVEAYHSVYDRLLARSGVLSGETAVPSAAGLATTIQGGAAGHVRNHGHL